MALFIVWKKKREKWQKDRSAIMNSCEVQMGERNVVATTSPTPGEDNEPGINSNFSHTVDDIEDMYGTTKITAGEDNDSTNSTDDEKHEQLYDENHNGTTTGNDENENASPTEIVYASEDDDMYDNENTNGQTLGKDPTSDVGTPTMNFHQSTHL